MKKHTRRQRLALVIILVKAILTLGLAVMALILLPADLRNIALGVILLAATAATALLVLESEDIASTVLWSALGLSLIGAGATGLLGLTVWEVVAHLIGAAASVCLLGCWAWQGIRSLRAWLQWRRVRAARMDMLRARNLAEGRYRA